MRSPSFRIGIELYNMSGVATFTDHRAQCIYVPSGDNGYDISAAYNAELYIPVMDSIIFSGEESVAYLWPLEGEHIEHWLDRGYLFYRDQTAKWARRISEAKKCA